MTRKTQESAALKMTVYRSRKDTNRNQAKGGTHSAKSGRIPNTKLLSPSGTVTLPERRCVALNKSVVNRQSSPELQNPVLLLGLQSHGQ